MNRTQKPGTFDNVLSHDTTLTLLKEKAKREKDYQMKQTKRHAKPFDKDFDRDMFEGKLRRSKRR